MRETAQRTLSRLGERARAEQVDGRYRSTPAGDLILDEYDELAATATHAARLGTFLANVGDDAVPPSSGHGELTVRRNEYGSESWRGVIRPPASDGFITSGTPDH